MEQIIFIGDTCLDVSYFGHTQKMSPEKANLQIFTVEKKDTDFGMVGNTFRNFCNIIDFYKFNINAKLITNTNNMPTKHRQYDSSGNMIYRFDENDNISEQFQMSNLIELLSENTKMVVISDYDKGFLSYSDIKDIAEICKQNNTKVLIDTKKLLFSGYFENIDFIKLNSLEYKNNMMLIEENNFYDKIIVTLSEKGCMYQNEIIETPYKYNDTVKIYPEGCGDTFVAGFVLNYILDNDIIKSINFGMEMAGKVLTKKGVALPFNL